MPSNTPAPISQPEAGTEAAFGRPDRNDPPGRRRFYRRAGAGPSPDGAGGFAVLLDGRPVRTPGKALLRLPCPALAEDIAAEWEAQTDAIRPHTMPLTRLANTALERVAPDREALVTSLLDYSDADALCYRAPPPSELRERQARDWQPVVVWAEGVLSARLSVTEGVMPLRQSPETVAALRRALLALDDWTLTGAQAIAGAAGSLVLALAVVHRRLDGESCFALSRLEEMWQAERWGEDREALQAREAVRIDILAADRFCRLARQV